MHTYLDQLQYVLGPRRKKGGPHGRGHNLVFWPARTLCNGRWISRCHHQATGVEIAAIGTPVVHLRIRQHL